MDEGEPVLGGILNKIYGGECITGADGKCEILNIPSRKNYYGLTIQDNREVEKYEKMRYIFPTLSEILPISHGFKIVGDADKVITEPLGQGFFTLPLPCGRKPILGFWFDVDPSPGITNYRGYTAKGTNGHGGIDYMGEGYPVLAAAPGIVIGAGEDTFGTYKMKREKGLEKYVEISHGPLVSPSITTYHHLAQIEVRIGDLVKRGDPIGIAGHTGTGGGIPHLHFDIYDGSWMDLIGHEFGKQIDPYRNLRDPNSIGYWTVDNHPICLPLEK